MEQFFVRLMTMEHLPILLVVGLGVFALAAIVLHQQSEEEQGEREREAWTALAAKYELRPQGKGSIARRFPSFRSFSVGYARRSRLLESPGGEVLLGTYGFKTERNLLVRILAHRFPTREHEFNLCVLKTPGLELPRCLLRPQGLAEAWEKLLGGQDIDFADDPDFSKAFVLQGDDEEDVRARFDRRTREWLRAHRSRIVRLEACRDTLAFFAPRNSSVELEQLLNEARELLALWK